jgi:uncharacterized glyoxalase superfamily protein PhnB
MKEAGSRSHFTPDGWHTVTPRIVVHDAERLVEFLRRVFGATGDYRPDLPGNTWQFATHIRDRDRIGHSPR